MKKRYAAGVAMLAVALSAATPGQSKPADSLFASFEAPPKSARPEVRWWWPGNVVDDAGIEHEIAQLDEAGFGGAEIQSFNPGIPNLTGTERDAVNGFATPSFFGHVATAARTAGRRGMVLDYTFGSAWPAGGGRAITPELALVELTMGMTSVDGDTHTPIKITLPPRTRRMGAINTLDPFYQTAEGKNWRERFDARSRVVSVMAFRGTEPDLRKKPTGGLQLSAWSDVVSSGRLDLASRVDLTSKLAADGTLDWTPPPGHWVILVFEQYASNMGVMGVSGRGPQFVLDHYNPKAFAAHAARVGDPLVATLGKDRGGMRATFVDSLELFQDLPWTPDFLAEFRKRRGYDLEPWLPFVVQPGWMEAWASHYSPPYFKTDSGEDLADRVRADYQQTVSDLLLDGFVRPWKAWNQKHGFETKFQAHGGPIDVLLGYGLADIPETEDLNDGADPYFMRLARAAGNIYGHNVISAESMVWKDRPYSVTPDEMRRRADLLFASGVNAETVHGFSYALHTDHWPGWFAFQPSAFATGFSTMVSPTNPIWKGIPALTRYMGRMNATLRQGHSVVPVAIFLGETGFYNGIDGKGDAERDREKALIASGYDFDRINPDGLAHGKVVNGHLETAAGHRYDVLVMPDVRSLRAKTAATIAAFAKKGLPIVFVGGVPDRDTGYFDYQTRDLQVRAAMKQVLSAGGRTVTDDGLVPALKAVGVRGNLAFTGDASGVLFVERAVGPRRIYFFHNASEASRDGSFVAPLAGGAEIWDAMTGKRSAVTATAVAGGTKVPLSLAPGASALIVIDPKDRAETVAAPREVAAETLPADGWSLSVDGHVMGGVPFTKRIGQARLTDWRGIDGLQDFAGTGTYSRTFDLPAAWSKPGARVMLDLGGVHDMAVVTVNGKSFPPTISAPWQVDVTAAVHAGENRLTIAIANVPENAMVDPNKPGFKNLKSVPAGLEGPVSLRLVAPK